MPHAEGSCLIVQGKTRVLVVAPRSSRRSLRSCATRAKGGSPPSTGCSRAPRSSGRPREAAKGKQTGRTLEIQRLIGRALRGVADRTHLPGVDGHARLRRPRRRRRHALRLGDGRLGRPRPRPRDAPEEGRAEEAPLPRGGRGDLGRRPARPDRPEGVVALDLDYTEDSTAHVDLNVVGTSTGRYVEVQGTAEREPFDDKRLREMLTVARTRASAASSARRGRRSRGASRTTGCRRPERASGLLRELREELRDVLRRLDRGVVPDAGELRRTSRRGAPSGSPRRPSAARAGLPHPSRGGAAPSSPRAASKAAGPRGARRPSARAPGARRPRAARSGRPSRAPRTPSFRRPSTAKP